MAQKMIFGRVASDGTLATLLFGHKKSAAREKRTALSLAHGCDYSSSKSSSRLERFATVTKLLSVAP